MSNEHFPGPADPNSIHHKRAVAVGQLIKRHVQKHGYYESYGDLLRWMSAFLRCSEITIRQSLVHRGLWISGRRGQRGGIGLYLMQMQLIAYAETHERPPREGGPDDE